MNARTLKALKGSIRKWEKIVAGKGRDFGMSNCPLCKLFSTGYYCTGTPCCPVAGKAGEGDCRRTPYVAWVKHIDTCRMYIGGGMCPTCKKLAKKELQFLKTLLPKEVKNKTRKG
jgi:hypothetical protein